MSFERAYNLVGCLIKLSPHGLTFTIQIDDTFFTLISPNIQLLTLTHEHALIKINSGFIVYVGKDNDSYPISNRGQIFLLEVLTQ